MGKTRVFPRKLKTHEKHEKKGKKGQGKLAGLVRRIAKKNEIWHFY